MKTKIGIIGALALLLVGLFAMSAVALTPDWVEVDGHKIDGTTRFIERDDELNIEMSLTGGAADSEDVRVEVELNGYKKVLRAETGLFDIEAGKTYIVDDLAIEIPADMEEDVYGLIVRIEVGKNAAETASYNIKIGKADNQVTIKDVVLSPENNVKAGRSLLATVRVENTGKETVEEDIKVTVSIPELDVSASDYIDEIEEDDAKSSEELYLRIPTCADAKEYTLLTVVSYADGDKITEREDSIEVVEGDLCSANVDATEVSMGPQAQDVEAGESVIFPVTIKNNGKYGQTYTVSVVGADSFADVQINPANVVQLGAGESQAVYVYVGAREDASEGAHMFTLAVKSGEDVVEEFQLTANVKESNAGWDAVKKGLEIGLIVLVVLLIILGLVIAFNKMKGNEDEGDEEASGQTYY